MTWWAWVLLWLVLVGAGALVLFLVARRLLRQGAALARELGEAADLLDEVSRRLDAPSAAAPTPGVRRPVTRGSGDGRRRRTGSQDVRWR